MDVDKRYKVLIVEDDIRYSEPLKMHLNQTEDFVTMAVTDSATEAFRLVKAGLPDAMIVDLQLREGDGVQLLQQIFDTSHELPIRPYTLALTSVMSERMRGRLNSGLADFTFSKKMKGYHPELLVGHLRAMSLEFDRNTMAKPQEVYSALDKDTLIRTRVERELDHYYIKPGNEAKEYLIDAVCIVISMPRQEKPVLKKIFAEVGKKYGKECYNVNIRISYLIHAAFIRTDETDLANAYRPYRDVHRGAPTNKEFIFYIADKIRSENIV